MLSDWCFRGLTKADGLHYRQPWVIGVQEEMVRMRERVDEAVEIIKCVPILTKQIESLEVCEHFLSLWVIIKFEIIKFVNTFYVFISELQVFFISYVGTG